MQDDEVWAKCPGFPDYDVSNLGNIYNIRTKREMSISYTNHGHPKITLSDVDGIRRTRSVTVLVAEVFVKKPHPDCVQPITLDGNPRNIAAYNLAWRPTHFAWKYTRQMKGLTPVYFQNLPVVNEMTNVEYESIIDCGMTEGLLFADIWRSTHSNLPVYPTNCTYAVLERV